MKKEQDSPNVENKTISKLNVVGNNRLFFYELLELFQTVRLSMDMHSPIRIFFMGEGNTNISALQSIQRIRNNSGRDSYFVFESDTLTIFLREMLTRVTVINTTQNTEKEKNNTYFTLSNLEKCISTYESSMELIISDAFLPQIHSSSEISEDYIQDHEYQTTRIAMLQVCFALCMQKKNGIFILKIGDCFSPLSLDLICILSSFYTKTYFTKPTVSDSSSSARFIVCKGFMYDQIKGYYPVLKNIFERVLSTGLFTGPSSEKSSVYLSRFIKWNIPTLFVTKIEEINSIFGQPQLEQLQHIHSILTHKYKQDKINHFIKSNIQKCIQWCIKYKIPFRNI
jgi:23S rRNA U2552 (ribose-2'-O)-methylase RlmE/FtsJ